MSLRDSRRNYVAHEFNVPQAYPPPIEVAAGPTTPAPALTQRDIEDARATTAKYIVKDLKQVVKALAAKAIRANARKDVNAEDAYEFAIELVKSVIDSHS